MEEQQQQTKTQLIEGQNPILLWGIVYIVVLALAVWLIYAFRTVQIQTTNSKIDSIKKEVTSQVGEDELAQLETITGQMATLYGQPFATVMLKNISSAIPKNTKLTTVSFSGSQIDLQGTASSYDEVSLFVATLNNQDSILKNTEIASASASSLNTGSVDFTLQSNLK